SVGAEIDRCHLTLVATLQLVADPLALPQVAHTGALDRRDVDEHVLRAVLRLNEPVSLLGIEPLDRASRHIRPPRACRRAGVRDGSTSIWHGCPGPALGRERAGRTRRVDTLISD